MNDLLYKLLMVNVMQYRCLCVSIILHCTIMVCIFDILNSFSEIKLIRHDQTLKFFKLYNKEVC